MTRGGVFVPAGKPKNPVLREGQPGLRPRSGGSSAGRSNQNLLSGLPEHLVGRFRHSLRLGINRGGDFAKAADRGLHEADAIGEAHFLVHKRQF